MLFGFNFARFNRGRIFCIPAISIGVKGGHKLIIGNDLRRRKNPCSCNGHMMQENVPPRVTVKPNAGLLVMSRMAGAVQE